MWCEFIALSALQIVQLGLSKGFGDLDLKKGVDHDLKLEKGEVWNKI